MTTTDIVSSIDEEIARLQHARSLLAKVEAMPNVTEKRGPGRPKKASALSKVKGKRVMSAEGRARIAAAQKKRHAAAKKAAKAKK